MAVTPEDLNEFLVKLCSADEDPLLLARDKTSGIGWRPWTGEDSQALCDWLSAMVDEDRMRGRDLACYKLKEAARIIGVSVPKFQSWLRRRDHPVPHVRDGPVILIPVFLLAEWLREESERSRDSRT